MKIKIADAILKGRGMITPNDGSFTLDRKDKGWEGCACGMALYAMGERKACSASDMAKHWPEYPAWKVWEEVTDWYFQVVEGAISWEEMIENVREKEASYEHENRAIGSFHLRFDYGRFDGSREGQPDTLAEVEVGKGDQDQVSQ